MTGVRLQASPTDTSPGSFINVPGVPNLKGTLWNVVFSEVCQTNADCAAPATCDSNSHACVQACSSDSECAAPAKCVLGSCSNTEGNVALYIADVERDASPTRRHRRRTTTSISTPSTYRQPATRQWTTLCPLDDEGKARAMAIPLDPRDWTSDASRAKIAFACTASGVAAKCARNWGYKPWSPALAPYYSACLIAARADYCQNEQSFTRDGTLVDLFDSESINPTVGLPFAPNAARRDAGRGIPDLHRRSRRGRAAGSGVHEPAGGRPDAGQPAAALGPAVEPLRRSRSRPLVRGGAYIDRCDPHAPYVCYRATNMSGQSLWRLPGGELGAPMRAQRRPVRRAAGRRAATPARAASARSIRPAAEIPGPPSIHAPWRGTIGASRCATRCAAAVPASRLWPPGQAGRAAARAPPVFLHGAVGSFEVIVADGGGNVRRRVGLRSRLPRRFQPDPDLRRGRAGRGRRDAVHGDRRSAAGGGVARRPSPRRAAGAGRHGFRFPLPADAAGKDMYVYGVDLNVPGRRFRSCAAARRRCPSGAARSTRAPRSGPDGSSQPAPPATRSASGSRGRRACARPFPRADQPGGRGSLPDLGERRLRRRQLGRPDADRAPDAFTLPPPAASPAAVPAARRALPRAHRVPAAG